MARERDEEAEIRTEARTRWILKRVRALIWNSIIGLLIFVLANRFLDPPMPYASWPLLLAVVLGVPGALAAILVWVLIT